MPTWAIISLIAVGLGAVYLYLKKHKGAAMARPLSPVQSAAKSKPKSRWRRALGGVANVAKVGAQFVPGGQQALSVGGQLGVV